MLAVMLEGWLIGGCGLFILNIRFANAGIGYCLVKEYWSNGYGTELAAALLSMDSVH